jgi:hypothetical protein
MMRRCGGFVRGWLSVDQAASWLQKPQCDVLAGIQIGELVAMRFAGGEMLIPESVLRGLDARVTEH